MSSYFSDNDEESDNLTNEERDSSEEKEVELSEVDRDLLEAMESQDTAGVQQALGNGANVNSLHIGWTILMCACHRGYNEIARILLDAGADPWWKDRHGRPAMIPAVVEGHLSIVEMLLNHDKDLLEIKDRDGHTPLFIAIIWQKFEIARLLLDRGANTLATTKDGSTTLMLACYYGVDLETVRRLLAAGVPVDARGELYRTALHYATVDVVREFIVDHSANMFAADEFGKTPFDLAARSNSANGKHLLLIECYSNKLAQEHGRLSLHAILGAAEYSFIEEWDFHPPLNPLRIRLPLGKLTLNHFRILLSAFDVELFRKRDERGMLPMHLACQANAPFEVLSVLVEMDPATLQIADHKEALPIHSLFGSGMPIEFDSVRYLVEQGGVETLTARNHEGALPLHVFCGSTNPPLRTVQYLVQLFPGSVAARTYNGQYPFMVAACDSSTASLSVVYELVRTNPNVIVPIRNDQE